MLTPTHTKRGDRKTKRDRNTETQKETETQRDSENCIKAIINGIPFNSYFHRDFLENLKN